MLQHLWIKDYILIDELSLDFKPGFSVFTGETGAGKSIIIDAIAILTGGRTSDAVIREQADQAIIEGLFDLSGHPSRAKFQELGFDDDQIIITKEINRGGKTVTKLNHRSINISLLKDLFAEVIDIHNQKESQYLLDEKSHIKLLDNYIGPNALMNEYQTCYREYQAALKALTELTEQHLSADEIEYIEFQLQEIRAIDPKLDEEAELEAKIKEFNAAEKIFQVLELTQNQLNENNGILEKLFNLKNELEKINLNPTINQMIEQLTSNYFDLEELNQTANQYVAQLDFDEVNFNALNERLFVLNKLKRKYGNDLAAVLKQKQIFTDKIAAYQNQQASLSAAETKVQELANQAEQLAEKLSSSRHEAAQRLEQAISQHFTSLELPHARFQVVFSPAKLSNSGSDKVEFYLTTNIGQSLGPLAKVASGGELSRVMLGLKAIFSRLQGISTIIFDEIDTGLSGKVANAIGHKMRDLAQSTQVLAITHLPQVASIAQQHYQVKKMADDKQTLTAVVALSAEEVINELAFMSTGNTTEKAVNAARELYDQNQQLWNN